MIDAFEKLYRTLVVSIAEKNVQKARDLIERVRIASDELTGIVNTKASRKG